MFFFKKKNKQKNRTNWKSNFFCKSRFWAKTASIRNVQSSALEGFKGSAPQK